jgi:hypothetical protein
MPFFAFLPRRRVPPGRRFAVSIWQLPFRCPCPGQGAASRSWACVLTNLAGPRVYRFLSVLSEADRDPRAVRVAAISFFDSHESRQHRDAHMSQSKSPRVPDPDLWTNLLLRMETSADTEKVVVTGIDQFSSCARCCKKLNPGCAVYFAFDSCYCCQACRVLGIAPRKAVREIEAALTSLDGPPDNASSPATPRTLCEFLSAKTSRVSK